jgi:hypothetical protein
MEQQSQPQAESPAGEKKISMAKTIIINIIVATLVSLVVSFAVSYALIGNRISTLEKKITTMESDFTKIFGKIKINGQ